MRSDAFNSARASRRAARVSRRAALGQIAAGFGSVALAGLMSQPAFGGPLSPKPTHFPAKAKRVIFLFMHGGPSHIDLFDHKPDLIRDNGKPLPFPKPRVVSSATGELLASPWKFAQHGQSGAWVSELLPETAKIVDDLCIIRSMNGSNSRHGAAMLELQTGSDTFVRPSMGAWITYGLGSESEDLPGFVTFCPSQSHGGANLYGSAFLPADYQGTAIGNSSVSSKEAKIPFVENADGLPRDLQRMELDLLQELNRERLAEVGPDDSLEARINSFELAFRMQAAAPELQDVSGESAETLSAYGLDNPETESFGRQCLMARRFVERGVRFVQCSHGYWDSHGNLRAEHAKLANQVDKPIAALINDLKQRGLLDETLVLWGGEFGRTPVAQGGDGRDHNPHGYTMWMAGGGSRPGTLYGQTDEYGYYAVEDKVHLHDLHATMLHLLGLDHKQLTYRFAGRDFRLTDVYGEVISGLIKS